MVEMWVEVLTLDQARKLPLANLSLQSSEEYEIRLIIWETRDVPLVNGETVNIFMRVLFDPTGWSSEEVTKETDTHYASRDGRGVFNYRFKFSISTPCQFPRLKFQIYGQGVVNHEAIGESTLNLKKTMSMLQKEGRLEIPKTYISFHHPGKKNEDSGLALITMTIIPKAEADAEPVGEAQDEPNVNPKLEKPTEGRGFGEALNAIGIDVGAIKLPKFNMFRNLLIFGVVAGVIFLILIVLMFFMP
mmetsp:Transcript_3157/g.3062  ORF Transcript_3157/g.3062 Transcript_3157/m.3062 type:complete len:246 (+) Transcript_3157:1660-2397(+)